MANTITRDEYEEMLKNREKQELLLSNIHLAPGVSRPPKIKLNLIDLNKDEFEDIPCEYYGSLKVLDLNEM